MTPEQWVHEMLTREVPFSDGLTVVLLGPAEDEILFIEIHRWMNGRWQKLSDVDAQLSFDSDALVVEASSVDGVPYFVINEKVLAQPLQLSIQRKMGTNALDQLLPTKDDLVQIVTSIGQCLDWQEPLLLNVQKRGITILLGHPDDATFDDVFTGFFAPYPDRRN